MAESKSSLLAKSVQKHAGRAKEKLLQNLGKVDRTADEIFDEHLTNFNRQQTNANRLQKEFNNYIRCIRAVQLASKSLMDAICDVYETPWSGAEALHAQVSAIEVLWQDFSHKLGDQVLIPLNTYTAQFPEMKKKIEKRNRKLIDYDSQRHSFQSLQANSNKRRDDVKVVTKGREQLEEARRTYEILNTELHDELPALHDSRILFLVTNLQTLFASEQVFHNETSKIFAELEGIVDKLATDSQRGSYTIKKIPVNSNQASPPHSPSKLNSTSSINANNLYPTNALTNGSSNANSASSPPSSPSSPSKDQSVEPPHNHRQPSPTEIESAAAPMTEIGIAKNKSDDFNNSPSETEPAYQNTAMAISNVSDDNSKRSSQIMEQNNLNANTSTKLTTNIVSNKTNNDNINNHPNDSEYVNGNIEPSEPAVVATATTGATTDLPPGVLYRVKATYKYVKEDVDELSFEVGDTIRVIEYDDPEDQEEGWLMGTKEGSTEKGLFPANFTRPL